MQSVQDVFHELSYYTLSHKSPIFIHQYIVDAFAAQTAENNIKPIKIAFALIGLYLHIEKNYSGKMVQQAHVELAKYKKQLPTFVLPENRGDITVFDVLKTPPGEKRDEEITKWSQSVWQAYKGEWEKVKDFLEEYLLELAS